MRLPERLRRAVILAAVLVLVSALPALAGATITIVNVDGPNEGFNDPTPAAAVNPLIKGNNPGATLGAMRQIAFQFAADVWGSTLDSNVEIFIQASFDPLGPNTLGAAGTIQIFANVPSNGAFPGTEFEDTWYHVALANKRFGDDLAPGPNGTIADDIVAFFNSNFNFYLGTDNNHGPLNDLVVVLLHEFGHGLGFANFVTEATGSNAGPPFFTDIFSRYTLDETNNLHWSEMNDAQRQASALRVRRIVWDGANVTAEVPTVLSFGTPRLVVNSPPTLAGTYPIGTASFGPPLTASGTTGTIVAGVDADEDGAAAVFTTLDGCSPYTNAADVPGNIALVNRGGCTFTAKALVAQAAGAIALIVENNVAASPPPGLGGVDPAVTIPSVMVSQADGELFRANLPVNVTLSLDLSQRAGASATGFALLNATNPVQPGSSISHWDPVAFRNLLMEPAINPDLTHSVAPPADLTLPEMRDIGWFADGDVDGVPNDGTDDCPASDLGNTVVIDECDSGVPNAFFATGCTITDLVMQCAVGPKNHGAFVNCVGKVTNSLKKAGVLTGAQRNAILECAEDASIP